MNIAEIWRYDLRQGATDHPANGACLFDAGMWLVYGKVGDNPPCSCPVIRAYAIGLNDRMDDATRQQLKPFILRVVGNRDPQAEPERLRYICVEAARRVVPIAFDAAGLSEWAAKLRSIPVHATLDLMAARATEAAGAARAAEAAWAAWAAGATRATRATRAARAAWAAEAACAAEAARAAGAAVNRETIAILDAVLRIGKQSPEFDEARVRESVGAFERARA